MSTLKTAIPKGSLVLITGVTGHVASHAAKMFLERGFRVRGTVRDLEIASWLKEDGFKPFADSGDLELFLVPDMGVKNAFAEAIKGVSAIVHVASIMSWSENANEVIPPVVEGITSLLEGAASEPSVKSFVYTSSIAAAVEIVPGVTTHAGPGVYNTRILEQAWAPPPPGSLHWHIVYMGSKVEAERAVWAFKETAQPSFAINVVSPSTILGEPFNKKQVSTPYPWIKKIYEGDDDISALFPAIIHIDVKDTALLHVAAVLDPECNGARLQAWNEYCNMNDILAILRKMYPQREFRKDYPNQSKLSVTADLEQPLALLKKWGGQDGWTPLEKSVAEEVQGYLKWYPET